MVAETVQDTPEIAEKKSRGLGSYVLWVFVALMVYVLSSGPVMHLDRTHRVGLSMQSWLDYAYAPCGWAYFTTAFHKPLGMYWHIWNPRLFDKDGDAPPIGRGW